MAEIHDLILAAIDAHRRVSVARSRFLDRLIAEGRWDEGGECGDLHKQYCEAAMSAARRLTEIEPATLAGVQAILIYVDEGERNQDSHGTRLAPRIVSWSNGIWPFTGALRRH